MIRLRLNFKCGCTVEQPVNPTCVCGECEPIDIARQLFDYIVEAQTCKRHPAALRDGIAWVGDTREETGEAYVLATRIERMLM